MALGGVVMARGAFLWYTWHQGSGGSGEVVLLPLQTLVSVNIKGFNNG